MDGFLPVLKKKKKPEPSVPFTVFTIHSTCFAKYVDAYSSVAPQVDWDFNMQHCNSRQYAHCVSSISCVFVFELILKYTQGSILGNKICNCLFIGLKG